MNGGKTIKIGISGKRQIAPEESQRVDREIGERIRNIFRHYKCDQFTGYSSLAAGADSIFAKVVTQDFRQPLEVILPFPREEYEKDFEDPAVFRSFLKEAAHCEVAAELPQDGLQRNEAYFKAGKMIADSCDEMVIVWDGMKPGGLGGTADVVAYWAEKKQHYPIHYIRVQTLNTDPIHEELIDKFKAANGLAIKARNRYKRVWKWVILLGWTTVACFAVKTAYYHQVVSWSRLFTLLEFLCVVAVYLLIWQARRRGYHREYLEERVKAETYRLMRSFYHAGVRIGISESPRDKDLAALAEKINASLVPEPTRTKWYTQYVIRCLIAEQRAYHHKKKRSIGNLHQVFERIKLVIGILFIVNLASHLFYVFRFDSVVYEMWMYKLSVFFNILLPATYAAVEGMIYFNEWATLKSYSVSAEQSLKEARDLLPSGLEKKDAEDCYKAQAEVLHLVSGIMLTDNKNWNLLLENKGDYHMMV